MMQGEEVCVHCYQHFTELNLARIIPTCGHNVCTNCLKKMISNQTKMLKCSICLSLTPIDEDELEAFPKDLAIIKFLRESNNHDNSTSKKESEDTDGDLLIYDSRYQFVFIKGSSRIRTNAKVMERHWRSSVSTTKNCFVPIALSLVNTEITK